SRSAEGAGVRVRFVRGGGSKAIAHGEHGSGRRRWLRFVAGGSRRPVRCVPSRAIETPPIFPAPVASPPGRGAVFGSFRHGRADRRGAAVRGLIPAKGPRGVSRSERAPGTPRGGSRTSEPRPYTEKDRSRPPRILGKASVGETPPRLGGSGRG